MVIPLVSLNWVRFTTSLSFNFFVKNETVIPTHDVIVKIPLENMYENLEHGVRTQKIQLKHESLP